MITRKALDKQDGHTRDRSHGRQSALMRILTAWAFVLGLTGGHAQASGLEYIFVYQCNATVINTTLVRACAARHPALVQQAEAAFAAWSLHHAAKAARAAEACQVELRVMAPTAAERTELQVFIHATLRTMIDDIEQQAVGQAYCQNALGQMADVRGHFDSMFQE